MPDKSEHSALMQTTLKKYLTAVVCLFLCSGAAVAAVAVGDLAPDFVLRSSQGDNLRLSEYRSEVVVVTFWSSWCGRCREALPLYQSLLTQYGANGLHVLGVAIEGDKDIAAKAVTSLNLHFPMLLDQDGKVSRAYNLGKLPLTVVINREGEVVFVDSGFRGNSDERIAAEVASLLVD